MKTDAYTLSFALIIVAVLPHVIFTAEGTGKPRILEVSNNMYELEATSVRLDCRATGVGHGTKINWFHAESGLPVEDYHAKPATSNKMIMSDDDRVSILFLGLKRTDEGKYYCNATNSFGWTVSRNISVQIAFLHKSFVHPLSKRAKKGETVQMECRPPRGLPKPKVMWKKNGKLIKENEPRSPGMRPHYMILPNGNLRIYDAQISDSGRFQCLAMNKAGRRESNVATLQVREKPTFILPPSDERANINDDVIFRCGVKGDPTPTIVWKRVDGDMPARNEILSDNSLKLYQVQLSYSGRYVCQASNKVGRIEAVAHLIVQSPPSFTRTPMDKEVTVNDKVVFYCEVAGRPRPAVYWQFGESPLMFTEHATRKKSRIQVHRDGRLVISQVRKSDEGRYVCHATSYEKHIRSTAQLTVLDGDTPYPPVIKFGPVDQVLHSGRNALLRCILGREAKAKRTQIVWFKNGNALTLDFADPRYVASKDGSLQIADVTPEDSGNFTCVARGPDGLSTNLTASLRVLKKSYTADEASRVVSASDIKLFPKQPIRLSLLEVQDTWVHLKWQPNPDIGTSQSQSYQVEAFCMKDKLGWVVKEAEVHQAEFRVKNLKPDTDYRFLVRARNIHGLGAPSALTNVIHTKVKSSMPNDVLHVTRLISEVRIQNVRINSIASDAVRIRWEVRGRPQALLSVRGFEIKYRELALTRCIFNEKEKELKYMYCSLQGYRKRLLEDSLRSGDRAVYLNSQRNTEKTYTKYYKEQVSTESRFVTYIIYRLKPFRCYSVEIEPYTLGEFIGHITGQDSKKKVTLTFDSVPVKAPDRISARWFVNNSVEISWRPPPVNSRNGVLDGYSIHIVGNETRFNKYRTTNASQRSIVVNDMVPEVAYTIHLAARTCKGEGVRSIALRLGPSAQRAAGRSVITQSWFIGTMVGVGIVWILLCLITVYVCRHQYHRNLLYKPVYFNGSLEERTQMSVSNAGGYNMRSLVGKHDPDSMPPPPPPPLSVVGSEKPMSTSSDANVLKNGAYATPSSVLPPIAPVQNPVAPYATASIIQNMINLQPQTAVSGAYCAASDNSVSEAKMEPGGPACVLSGANSSSYGGHYSEGGPPGTCSEYSESQGEEPMGATGVAGWPASIVGGRQKIKNIGEIIPPPPEYPPPPAPSSGSSAPMSPKPGLSLTMGTSMMNGSSGPMSVRLPVTSDHSRHPGDVGPTCDGDSHADEGESAKTPLVQAPSYNPQVSVGKSSSGLPGPASPLATEEGVYTGIDSDTEGETNSEEDETVPVLGRRSPGMQSSLVGEPGESCAGSSVLASWASGLTGDCPGVDGGGVHGEDDDDDDDDDDDISSVDSSCSDSHVPFLPESDFATAVQMAANAAASAAVAAANNRRACGQTLPGAMPGAARRRRHPPRTPSPGYSTDSNYAALPPQPHRPYPKSERKRQMKNYGGGGGTSGASSSTGRGRSPAGPHAGARYMYTAQPYHLGGHAEEGSSFGSFTDSPIV